ncbi:MAG: T9SS type A sorting domain-containing protein [Balneolaceae bacterium]
MPLKCYSVLLIWLILFPALAFAQDRTETHRHVHHPTQIAIDEAYSRGDISRDEAILQHFYAGYRPNQLSQSFSRTDTLPIKCMLPVQQQYLDVKSELNASTVSEIEQMTASSTFFDTEFEYISPSGVFSFHYDTTGVDSVPTESTIPEAVSEGIPDYIYHAAFAADSSYRYQVEDSGFSDFRTDEPYEISFRNFGFYGTTTSSGSTSFIEVHNNFVGFPTNTHPGGNQIGALYATLAHEIKHAVQFEANRWRGNAGRTVWIEMDATLMEEVVFDDVNDYYNYIKTSLESNTPTLTSIFGRPQSATPGSYWHVSWMIYFQERYGTEFWVDVWDIISNEPLIVFTDAMNQVLNAYNTSIEREHLKNHLWHMGSGDEFSLSDDGFSERLNYPNPNFQHQLFSATDSLTNFQIDSLAANYVHVLPPILAEGQPKITIESTNPGVGISAIGYFNNGSTEEAFFVNPQESFQELQTTWNWSELSMLSIGVVNTNQNLSSEYKLNLITAPPDDDLISQNYPNPFNQTTKIEFSLDDRKEVTVEVYDSIGRKISTLLNEIIDSGYHTLDFDGFGLPSGVYFYRITTDQTSITRKMVLIH